MFNADTNQCHNKKGDLISQIPQCIMNSRKVFRCKIHKGTVFVRLSIGVNAIAHSCYDSRTVGKKDQVSFVVTHIDEERNVALGIITRIIKQTI